MLGQNKARVFFVVFLVLLIDMAVADDENSILGIYVDNIYITQKPIVRVECTTLTDVNVVIRKQGVSEPLFADLVPCSKSPSPVFHSELSTPINDPGVYVAEATWLNLDECGICSKQTHFSVVRPLGFLPVDESSFPSLVILLIGIVVIVNLISKQHAHKPSQPQ